MGGVGGASESPELHDNVAAFGVDRVGDLGAKDKIVCEPAEKGDEELTKPRITDLLPSDDLLLRPNPRHMSVSSGLRGDECGLCL